MLRVRIYINYDDIIFITISLDLNNNEQDKTPENNNAQASLSTTSYFIGAPTHMRRIAAPIIRTKIDRNEARKFN